MTAFSETARVLVTGGAGFVGSSLCIDLRRRHPGWRIAAFDNLKRRGSEMSIERLSAAGVEFIHGDVRCSEDFAAAGPSDIVIDCSAEPSVQAGSDGNPAYVVNTNLVGTVNCLEYVRRCGAALLFLSSSRVYPIAALRALPLDRIGDRLTLAPDATGTGWSHKGISEEFPLGGCRSVYGATKLASEMLIEEYRAAYGVKAVVDRCGVIAGPWQMGKVDQGFLVLWVARHFFGGRLSYNGFGGTGLQVRDVLHVEDLCDLVHRQMSDIDRYDGGVYNAGGGAGNSVSLRELTELCRQATGERIDVQENPATHPADIPWYVTDSSRLAAAGDWRPSRSVAVLVEDVTRWLRDHRDRLRPLLGG